jgi:hypothetical protein
MNSDFSKKTFDLWIDNYKRPREINLTCRSWLESEDIDTVNVIVNHSSVNIDTFDDDLKPKVKLWPNVMRHDLSRGPITRNINQAYIHTFLSGKKYCIVAHDNMLIKPGWGDIIRSTDYEFYSAPCGDQVHIMSLNGLQKLGWWDERFATMGNHELDYLVRAVRKKDSAKLSIVDHHLGWPNELPFIRSNACYLNPCGLEEHFCRMSKGDTPQVGESRSVKLAHQQSEWSQKKWAGYDPTHIHNLRTGPKV